VQPKGSSRFYEVHIANDLLGDISVVFVNGRVNSRAGAIRKKIAASNDEAGRMLLETHKTRQKRGYKIMYIGR
jgi:predicted DNA-binding WGR domain protein